MTPSESITPTPTPPRLIGVGTDRQLWFRREPTSSWVQIPNSGDIISVTYLDDGSLLAVGSDHSLWQRDPLSRRALLERPASLTGWRRIPNSGDMVGVAAHLDFTASTAGTITSITLRRIIGVGTDHHIWTRDHLGEAWTQVANSGDVIAVSVLANGTIVGVGTDKQLYTRSDLLNDQWHHVSNSGDVIGVAGYPPHSVSLEPNIDPDTDIVGVGTDHRLYLRNGGLDGRWAAIGQSGDMIAITFEIKPPQQ